MLFNLLEFVPSQGVGLGGFNVPSHPNQSMIQEYPDQILLPGVVLIPKTLGDPKDYSGARARFPQCPSPSWNPPPALAAEEKRHQSKEFSFASPQRDPGKGSEVSPGRERVKWQNWSEVTALSDHGALFSSPSSSQRSFAFICWFLWHFQVMRKWEFILRSISWKAGAGMGIRECSRLGLGSSKGSSHGLCAIRRCLLPVPQSHTHKKNRLLHKIQSWLWTIHRHETEKRARVVNKY